MFPLHPQKGQHSPMRRLHLTKLGSNWGWQAHGVGEVSDCYPQGAFRSLLPGGWRQQELQAKEF